MNAAPDRFDSYYAEKLWRLVPAVYGERDATAIGERGPLRELVERLGTEVANVRRSIDRLWEDQSIETCDDWVIPYIGDLLATNLVPGMDAASRRVDVAKTIYYRRRKGTLALIEELAHDITRWDVKAVEFFRRLARARHNLDPAVGGDARLLRSEGLIGSLTGTPLGGFADLRSVYGARKTHGPFDEFAATADVRRGVEEIGWYGIPKIGIFIWKLQSFRVTGSTPVAMKGDPATFTADPTGRNIPLFAAGSRAFGDSWRTPREWELPLAIDDTLWAYVAKDPDPAANPPGDAHEFIPNSFDVLDQTAGNPRPPPVRLTKLGVAPMIGNFKRCDTKTDVPVVTYHYGFSSAIGAGTYDRRLSGRLAAPPAPVKTLRDADAPAAMGVAQTGPTGGVLIDSSSTFTKLAPLTVTNVVIAAANLRRPVLRVPTGSSSWKITGNGDTATLVLDGLWLCGCDLELSGRFASVTIRCSTLDPGNDGRKPGPFVMEAKPGPFAIAVDGAELRPVNLRIGDGTIVTQLTIDRSIVGPIVTDGTGRIEQLLVRESIVQAVPNDKKPPLGAFDAGADAVRLERTTVLGVARFRRLECSESILADHVDVEDTQHGCVRFSAFVAGSVLPRQYESAWLRPGATPFTSTQFGDPHYAELSGAADAAIVAGGTPGVTITAGAQDGSEMGAFAREAAPLRLRGLRTKLDEYMPVGCTPVFIEMD